MRVVRGETLGSGGKRVWKSIEISTVHLFMCRICIYNNKHFNFYSIIARMHNTVHIANQQIII